MSLLWQNPPAVKRSCDLDGETFRMAVVHLYRHEGKWALLLSGHSSVDALDLAEQARKLCPTLEVVARRRDGSEWGVWAMKPPVKARKRPPADLRALCNVDLPGLLTLAPDTRTEPSAAQREVLAQLRAQNRLVDNSLRKQGPCKQGVLPATCTEVGAAHVLPFLRTAARAAIKAGWKIGKGGKHHHWCGPDGQHLTTPTTNTEGGSNVQSILSSLKRHGVPVPDKHGKRAA